MVSCGLQLVGCVLSFELRTIRDILAAPLTPDRLCTLAVMIITGTGGTDYYPSSESTPETLVVTLLVLCGAFIWTYVLALFCDMATNANPARIDFRQRLDGLNLFISINRLPEGTARRLRAYLHQQKSVALQAECSKSLPLLSMPLQVEILLTVNHYWLESIWFIKELEGPVKVLVARAMKLRVLAPGESAPTRHLYVIQRGTIVYGARLLTRHMSFGDDIILTDPRYFLQFAARAITFADVLNIGRDTLYGILEDYPQSFRLLRRATIHLACRRAIVNLSRARMGGLRRLTVPGDASYRTSNSDMPSPSASPSVASPNVSPGRIGMRSRIFEGINFALESRLEAQQKKSMDFAHTIDKFEADSLLRRPQIPSTGNASSEADHVHGAAIPAELAAKILTTLGELKDSVSTLMHGQMKAQTESAAHAAEVDERLRQIELCLVTSPMNVATAKPGGAQHDPSPLTPASPSWGAAVPDRMFSST